METLIFGPGDYSPRSASRSRRSAPRPSGYPATTSTTSTRASSSPPAPRASRRSTARTRRQGRGRAARARQLARALGLDGKWTIHPGQIASSTTSSRPAASEWERAEAMLAAYERARTARPGRAMFEGEMIDEANRKMAERLASAGRAAGYGD
jgi:citrate lyase subunit beta/citryl-CoA lyase